MTEEYLQKLRRQLREFSWEEQEALMEEISSHIESGEEDPNMGKDAEQRRKKLMNELGSPRVLGKGFKNTYRPDRLIDYLLVAVPYLLYPILNSFYMGLMPTYSWADVRLDVVIHLPLVVLGLWRRSSALVLFWITILVSQLLYITTQSYWFYGIQTIFWALLLLGLVVLAGYILYKSQHDLLLMIFGLLSLSMCILGSIFSVLRPTGATSYGLLNQSLMVSYLSIRDLRFYLILGTMALFFLPVNRRIRWLALLLYGLIIGLGRDYLIEFQTGGTMTPIASWVYYLWIMLPILIVFFGWWLERSKGQQLELAIS